MRHQSEPTPRRPVPRRFLFFALACIGLVTVLGAAAPTAQASCSACGPPTIAQVAAAPGFALDVRYGLRDYYEVSGGDCEVTTTSTPRVTKLRSSLVLRGTGEVWNCPHSKSADTIAAKVAATDSKGWSLSASHSAKIGAFGASLEAKIVASVSSSVTISTTTSISKTIHAAYCVRIPWEAWFEVAVYDAEVDYDIERRFAWWTKNRRTGSTVHRKGDVWIPCGSGTAALDMQAPISGHFHLHQRGCTNPECHTVPSRDLGFFPPLTPPPTPDLPPDPDEDEDEDSDDEVPPSSELPDPPAGIPDPPPGFRTVDDEEPGS